MIYVFYFLIACSLPLRWIEKDLEIEGQTAEDNDRQIDIERQRKIERENGGKETEKEREKDREKERDSFFNIAGEIIQNAKHIKSLPKHLKINCSFRRVGASKDLQNV